MMRIAVFADTHGKLSRLPAAIVKAGHVDAFLHLGDNYADAARIAELLPVPYYAVRGNCDYWNEDAPRMLTPKFEEASLLLVHGDAFYGTSQLAQCAEEEHCAAALFGHTHIPLLAASGPVLIVNPGSLSIPRGESKPSFALLTVNGKDVNAKLIPLG